LDGYKYPETGIPTARSGRMKKKSVPDTDFRFLFHRKKESSRRAKKESSRRAKKESRPKAAFW